MKTFFFQILLFAISARAIGSTQFPRTDQQLSAMMQQYSSKPSYQAMLSYLYHFANGKEVQPPSKAAQDQLASTRLLFESEWNKVDWQKLKIQDFYLTLKASNHFRPAFEALPKKFAVYPTDVFKLFDKRAQMQQGGRHVSSQEASFWLALVPCLDAGGELFAAGFYTNIKHNLRNWIYALPDAENRIRSEEKLSGGLCGISRSTRNQHSPDQLKAIVELHPSKDKNIYKGFQEALQRASLHERTNMSPAFRNSSKALLDYFSEKMK
ncbi:hypothetical protein GW915_10240 [bacterium]|nr:hypothetical protein [bacterium]